MEKVIKNSIELNADKAEELVSLLDSLGIAVRYSERGHGMATLQISNEYRFAICSIKDSEENKRIKELGKEYTERFSRS